MAVTYGFYNSLNGDRKYDATQVSALFDGLITDGVFQAIGTAFAVTADGSSTVRVGIGRAWFNHTWTLNDAPLPLTLPAANVALPRWDSVVLEVASDQATRVNAIKILPGTAAASPVRPTLASTDALHQYALSHVYRDPGANTVDQSKITNVVGQNPTPFVVGVVQSVSIDALVAQWSALWTNWYNNNTNAYSNSFSSWLTARQSAFDAWFTALQTTLASNTATDLTNRITVLEADKSTLLREQAIYDSLLDSSNAAIADNSNAAITGRVIYDLKGAK